MKVSVIVQARFHAFEMASYFQKEGVLNELITGYPKSFVKRFGVDPKQVKSVYVNEIINRVSYKLFKSQRFSFISDEIFDFIASKVVRFDSDIYFIWSGCALRTIRAIRKKNPAAKIVLVRCSGHIAVQEELLRMVNPSKKQIIDKRMIAKEQKEYEETDYITLPSTFAYNSFINRQFPKEKLFLNLYGVDLKEFPFYEKKDKKDEQLVIGYVGALSKRKNITSIIHVVDKLNGKGINVKLILAGPIDYESFDPEVLKKHPFIDYRGKLPQTELHKVYAEMDVFVINSIEEGLAYVQMQAMSCGLPVISTTNAGGLDLVQDGINGFTIPILDEGALEEKITWFYHHKEKLGEMGKASRNLLSEIDLTWDDFGKRNITFMNEVLRSNN